MPGFSPSAPAVTASAAPTLPDLVGDSAQVEWASVVRAAALASPLNKAREARQPSPPEVARFEALLARELGVPEMHVNDLPRRIEAVAAVIRAARDRLETERRAIWWINNRDNIDAYVDRSLREEIRAQLADIKARHMLEPPEARPVRSRPDPATLADLAIRVTPLRDGAAVRFPRDELRNRRFREHFKRAFWVPDARAWFVPGRDSPRRVSLWAESEMAADRLARRAAQDAEIDRLFSDLP